MLKARHIDELSDPSALIVSLLADGLAVSFEAHGSSMLPTIRPGDRLLVRPTEPPVKPGDVVLVFAGRGLTAHRVVRMERTNHDECVVTRGDNCHEDDEPLAVERVLGQVCELRREGRTIPVDRRSHPRRVLWRLTQRLRSLTAAIFR